MAASARPELEKITWGGISPGSKKREEKGRSNPL